MAVLRTRSSSTGDILTVPPLLIYRVPMPNSKPGSAKSKDIDLQEPPLRRASLSHLWGSLVQELRVAMFGQIKSLRLDVLDATENTWVSVIARFESGRMLLERGAGGVFAVLNLPGAKIVGHLLRPTLQVISGTQTYLLHCRTHKEYIDCAAALFAWSKTREEGLYAKLWTPPSTRLDDGTGNLLQCKLQAHFTASNEDSESWKPLVGQLNKAGQLVLSRSKEKDDVFSLDISKISAGCVRRVDPSLVNCRWVLFIAPDMGGPESVYLKFANDVDMDDWFVSLRSFAKENVYASANHDPTTSLRIVKALKVKNIRLKHEDGLEDMSFRDTYVDLCFDDWIWARTFINDTESPPLWSQEFVFTDLEDIKSPLELNVRFADPVHGPSELSKSLGRIRIDESELNGDRWLPLNGSDLAVTLDLERDIVPVLDASHYRDLRAQLMTMKSHIAYKLGENRTSSIGLLCELFFNIYASEVRQLEWVESLIDCEMETYSRLSLVDAANVMFRGNTMMTRGLEKYLITTGRVTLERTVRRLVKKLVLAQDTFELDPSRIKASGPEERSKVLKASRHLARNYLSYIWNLILAEGVPESFRYIFTYLSRRMRESLQCSDELVWNAVSAFLFLRFYCPALLNPSMFGLTDTKLSTGTQRSMTILAKILQGFANRVKFGGKEAWLAEMNGVLDAHEVELIDWYVKLTSFSGQKRPLERPPKLLPQTQFLQSEVSNPYLIDKWLTYAKLVRWGAAVPFDPSWDAVQRQFFLECKHLANTETRVLTALKKPDTLEHVSDLVRELEVRINWNSLLFGTDPQYLEGEEPKRPEAKRRVTWRFFEKKIL